MMTDTGEAYCSGEGSIASSMESVNEAPAASESSAAANTAVNGLDNMVHAAGGTVQAETSSEHREDGHNDELFNNDSMAGANFGAISISNATGEGNHCGASATPPSIHSPTCKVPEDAATGQADALGREARTEAPVASLCAARPASVSQDSQHLPAQSTATGLDSTGAGQSSPNEDMRLKGKRRFLGLQPMLPLRLDANCGPNPRDTPVRPKVLSMESLLPLKLGEEASALSTNRLAPRSDEADPSLTRDANLISVVESRLLDGLDTDAPTTGTVGAHGNGNDRQTATPDHSVTRLSLWVPFGNDEVRNSTSGSLAAAIHNALLRGEQGGQPCATGDAGAGGQRLPEGPESSADRTEAASGIRAATGPSQTPAANVAAHTSPASANATDTPGPTALDLTGQLDAPQPDGPPHFAQVPMPDFQSDASRSDPPSYHSTPEFSAYAPAGTPDSSSIGSSAVHRIPSLNSSEAGFMIVNMTYSLLATGTLRISDLVRFASLINDGLIAAGGGSRLTIRDDPVRDSYILPSGEVEGLTFGMLAMLRHPLGLGNSNTLVSYLGLIEAAVHRLRQRRGE